MYRVGITSVRSARSILDALTGFWQAGSAIKSKGWRDGADKQIRETGAAAFDLSFVAGQRRPRPDARDTRTGAGRVASDRGGFGLPCAQAEGDAVSGCAGGQSVQGDGAGISGADQSDIGDLSRDEGGASFGGRGDHAEGSTKGDLGSGTGGGIRDERAWLGAGV